MTLTAKRVRWLYETLVHTHKHLAGLDDCPDNKRGCLGCKCDVTAAVEWLEEASRFMRRHTRKKAAAIQARARRGAVADRRRAAR